jgi:hypothetical protein
LRSRGSQPTRGCPACAAGVAPHHHVLAQGQRRPSSWRRARGRSHSKALPVATDSCVRPGVGPAHASPAHRLPAFRRTVTAPLTARMRCSSRGNMARVTCEPVGRPGYAIAAPCSKPASASRAHGRADPHEPRRNARRPAPGPTRCPPVRAGGRPRSRPPWCRPGQREAPLDAQARGDRDPASSTTYMWSRGKMMDGQDLRHGPRGARTSATRVRPRPVATGAGQAGAGFLARTRQGRQ